MPLPHSRQRVLHFHFLQLVAAVEQHQQKFRSQAYVIDELVDMAFEVNLEGEEQGKGKERLAGGMVLAKAGPASFTHNLSVPTGWRRRLWEVTLKNTNLNFWQATYLGGLGQGPNAAGIIQNHVVLRSQ